MAQLAAGMPRRAGESQTAGRGTFGRTVMSPLTRLNILHYRLQRAVIRLWNQGKSTRRVWDRWYDVNLGRLYSRRMPQTPLTR
jgi:hypothetical protein